MTSSDYRTSHLGSGKANKYHDGFSSNPYRAMMWDLERDVLDELIDQLPARASVLDYATGTGRVLHHVEGKFERSVGVDISPDMLEVARQGSGSSELHEADLTASNIFAGQTFDAIIAFRFFPNAQGELRSGSIKALASLLAPSGRLIFNNHKSAASIVYRAAGLLSMGKSAMSHDEVEAMLAEAGLVVDTVVGRGVLPSTEKVRLLPRGILERAERALCRIPALEKFAVNRVYVAKHAAAQST